jgi:hypothetical protein
MKLLIKFPTRGRRNKFLNVLNKYQTLLSNKIDVKFIITMDEDDSEMNNDLVRDVLSQFKNLVYFYGNSKTKIEAINVDIEKVEDWDIILLASDDMIPKIKGYDEIIVNKMEEFFPDTDGVLWFNDGNRTDLNTLSILGKKYYSRFKYIYNPEYKSTWSDNEFTDVANILGKQKYFDEIIIKHEHPDSGYGNRDIIHAQNFENEFHDKNIYEKNKTLNFGL